MTLLEHISSINTDLLAIDTYLSRMRKSLLEIRKESLDIQVNSADYELIMHPTRAAILDMVHQFNYHTVVLRPSFSDYTGATGYKIGSRRAFICAKQTDLTSLAPYDEPPESVQHLYTDAMNIPSKDMIYALAHRGIHRFGRRVRGGKPSQTSP
jgi:hypothetical protein